MTLHRPLAAAAVLALLPCVARGQAVPPPPAAPQPAPPVVAMDRVAASLEPVTWSYTARARQSGQVQELGTRTLRLTWRPAGWLMLLNEQNAQMSSTDSLLLAPDLSAERRVVRAQTPRGAMALTLAFGADSIVGTVDMAGQSQPVRVPNPRRALASDALILLALSRLPLAAGWQGTLEMVNAQTGGVIPFVMRVGRSESVTVPAGTFDAWVVDANAGAATTTFWVAKGGPVVRIVATVPQLPGAQIESTLQNR